MTLIISVNLGSSFCPKQHMHQKRLKHKHRCCLLSSLYWLHYWFGCLQLQDLANNAAEYARLWLRREKESARQGKILSEHLMRMSHLRSVWPSIFWWVSKVYLPILPMNFFFLVFGRIHTHISLRLNCLYTDSNNSPHTQTHPPPCPARGFMYIHFAFSWKTVVNFVYRPTKTRETP